MSSCISTRLIGLTALTIDPATESTPQSSSRADFYSPSQDPAGRYKYASTTHLSTSYNSLESCRYVIYAHRVKQTEITTVRHQDIKAVLKMRGPHVGIHH